MSKLDNALQPQAIPPAAPPAAPGAPPPKPGLDFKPMVEKASRGNQKSRGGLSSAMILMLQNLYVQQAQSGQPVQTPNNDLNSGWGGMGR